MLFDKMPEIKTLNLSGVGVDFLLQIKMGKVNYKSLVDECLFFLFDSARRVFDRGKEFQLICWILIWISTIVFATCLNEREKDGLMRIPVKSSMGNIRYLVLDTADTVYHRVCNVQLRASPCQVLLSLDACGVCFDRLLMEANTSAIFYGGSMKLHVGLHHEQGQGSEIIWMALKLCKVLLLTVYFLVSIIYLLRLGKDYSCLNCVLEWRTELQLKLMVVQDPEGLFYLSRIGTDYSYLNCVLAWRMGVQLKLVVVQDREGLSLMVSLRCTFKLFPTGVCSVRILFRFYGRVVGMHAATARANSPTALTLLFSFEREFTWFFSSLWSAENVIIVGVVDVSILAIPGWRILTMVGLKHLANGVIRTIHQKGDNTTCKDREPGVVVQTDLMATFKLMEVISKDLLDDPTVCIIYPISSTTTLQLVVSFMWNFTLTCVANRNWVLVRIFSQVGNLDVFSRWPFITEVYAVTSDIIFIYEVRVSNAVPEQLEWLASKSFIACQILKAEEMVNQLRHLTLNNVKTDGERGVYAVTFDMIFIYEVMVSNAVPEQLEWLASKSFFPCQIPEAEEMVNHLVLCKVKTDGERGVCMSASQEEICEDIGPVYRGKVSTRESNPLVSFDGRTATRYPTIFVILTR